MSRSSTRRAVDRSAQLEYADRAQSQHEQGAESGCGQKRNSEWQSARSGHETDLGTLGVLKDEYQDDCQNKQCWQHLHPRSANPRRDNTSRGDRSGSFVDVPLAVRAVNSLSHATRSHRGRISGSHRNPQSSPEHGSATPRMGPLAVYHPSVKTRTGRSESPPRLGRLCHPGISERPNGIKVTTHQVFCWATSPRGTSNRFWLGSSASASSPR